MLTRNDPESEFVTVRNNHGSRAIVFVHGVNIDAAKTWQRFPEILAAHEPEFDIFLIGPRGPLLDYLFLSLDELSERFYRQFATSELSRYERITFITHADAGLAVQLALTKHADLAARVERAFFFASPNGGLKFKIPFLSANIVSAVLSTFYRRLFPFVVELLPGSEFLTNLNSRWAAGLPNLVGSREYWSIAARGDTLVTFESLNAFPPNRRLLIEGDHASLTKPPSAEADGAQVVLCRLHGLPLAERFFIGAAPSVQLEEKAASGEFDVFLFYDRADQLAARALSEQLKQRGIRPWFDEDQVQPGDRWHDQFLKDKEKIRAAAVLIGKAVPGPESIRSAAIGEFLKRNCRVIPVYLPGANPGNPPPAPLKDEVTAVVLDDTGTGGLDPLIWGITNRRPKDSAPKGASQPLSEVLKRRRIKIATAILATLILIPAAAYGGWKIYKFRIDCGDVTEEALTPQPGRNTGHYVRQGNPDRVIVFVHGIFGSAGDTWTSPPSTYWPDLLAKDAAFDTDIYVAAYDTGLTNKMRVDEVATGLNQRLIDANIFRSHRQVIFVVHSLGGLVIQRLLLMYRDYAKQIPFIYFYATPQTGAQIAALGAKFTDDPLLREMAPGAGNDYLRGLESDWRTAKFGIKRYCAYEKLRYKCMLVVDEMSGTRSCDAVVAMNKNHANIVKPRSPADDSYIALRNAWNETFGPR